jgi:hypothetical protein
MFSNSRVPQRTRASLCLPGAILIHPAKSPSPVETSFKAATLHIAIRPIF